jgi:hypothetical protein
MDAWDAAAPDRPASTRSAIDEWDAAAPAGIQEAPRTFKNQPAVGAIRGAAQPVSASIPAGSVEDPQTPAWQQFLERQAQHPEEGGLIGPLVRGGAEAVGSTVLNAPGALVSQTGKFVGDLGTPEQFNSPTLQNVGSVLSRIGAAITPGHWSQPTTIVGSIPTAASEAIGKTLGMAGSGYRQLAEQAGAPRLGAIAGNVVSNLPLVTGAAEAAGAGVSALRGAISKPAAGSAAVGGTNLRTTPLPTVNQMTPETQAAVLLAQARGIPVNPDVLARHAEAESLPVPIKLTEGQASAGVLPGGLDKLSNEWNKRAQTPGMADLFNGQNGLLIDNIGAIKQAAAPDVSATTAAQTGQGVIDSYLRRDAPAVADIREKYQALADANGGNLPVDGSSFVGAAQQALARQFKTRYLPSEIQGVLDDVKSSGQMSFEQFENLRTDLASAQRTAERQGNGNAGMAVGIVRDALESLPMTGGAAALKPLADAARGAAKARFDALRADPAYNAAVKGTVPPDDFVQKFIVNGNDADVTLMRQNLDTLGHQHMAAGAMDYLSQRAGILNGTGNFSQAGLNSALYRNGLSSKLNSIFDPQTAQHVESLANTARYTQQQPRGSYVNNSNSFVAAAAHGLAETAAVAMGLPPGAVTFGREVLARRAAAQAAKKAMAPGAGITKP